MRPTLWSRTSQRSRVPITHLNPASMHANPALSQGTVIPARSSIEIVGGQNGVGADGEVVGDTIGAQTEQAPEPGSPSWPRRRDARRRREDDDHPCRGRRPERGIRGRPKGGASSQPRSPRTSSVPLARPDFLVEIDAIAAVQPRFGARDRTLTTMDRVFSREFHAADGAEAWRVLPEGAYAFFRSESIVMSARSSGRRDQWPRGR